MLHFLVPFIILIIVVAHLVFLHDRGSTSTLLCIGDYDKVKFFPFYMAKDGLNLLLWVGFFLFGSFLSVYVRGCRNVYCC